MSYGWVGKILRIDLTRSRVWTEETKKYIRNFIGGRGVNDKILYDEVPPEVHPFDPENLLIFGTGPLTGTLAPGSGRVNVKSKSPITNLLGDSNFGGFWGSELKFAGYDHLVIQGKADSPLYISIDDEEVEIKSARQIWGRSTFETQDMIKDELGDSKVRVISIGPAGEKLVNFACIITELKNAAGRTGMGAVMGSKRLKAIAVRGTKPVNIAKLKFEELSREARKILVDKSTNVWWDEISRIGIAGWMDAFVQANFYVPASMDYSGWDRAEEAALTPFVEKNAIKPVACYRCPIHCQRYFNVEGIGEGVANMCSQLLELTWRIKNPNPKTMWEIYLFCQKMGLDAVSMGDIICFSTELYQHGILTKEDAWGISLDWGSRDSIMTIAAKTVMREGLGDILAEGSIKAAEKIGKGSGKYLRHTKGLPYYGINYKAYKGASLATATGPRGDPLRSLSALDWMGSFDPERYSRISRELFGTDKAAVPVEYESKAVAVVYYEDVTLIHDFVGTCKWHGPWFDFPITIKTIAELLSACTGLEVDEKTLFYVADRILTLERAYNAREGVTRADDTLPKQFFEEPLPDGLYKGEFLDREKFEKMKDEYYRLRGWDIKTGIPTKERLTKLGLSDIAEDLLRKGKI